jgi:THO complex subunit 7
MPTSALESDGLDGTLDNDARSGSEGLPLGLDETGESEKEDGEDKDLEAVLLSTSSSLNITVPPFIPLQILSKGLEDDIEMGEVAEVPKVKAKKKVRDEELEEGEASDSSSALSDPPDD